MRGLPNIRALLEEHLNSSVDTNGVRHTRRGLYNVALIGRILLTWFPQAPEPIVRPLATVVDPYLNLFRGIIPPLGGTIDLSPILAFIVLDLFSNSASALGAEVGPDGRMVRPVKGPAAWQRRLLATTQRKKEASRQQQQPPAALE
ncbi:hypothetical protein N2152v2_011094 [Parachlorella kessleri]